MKTTNKMDKKLPNKNIYLSPAEKEAELEVGEVIKKTVCTFYGIPVELIENCTRKKAVVKARQQGLVLTYRLTRLSLEFAASLYNKTHAMVLHSNEVIENNCTHNQITEDFIILASDYKAEFELLTERVKQAILIHKGTDEDYAI